MTVWMYVFTEPLSQAGRCWYCSPDSILPGCARVDSPCGPCIGHERNSCLGPCFMALRSINELLKSPACTPIALRVLMVPRCRPENDLLPHSQVQVVQGYMRTVLTGKDKIGLQCTTACKHQMMGRCTSRPGPVLMQLGDCISVERIL